MLANETSDSIKAGFVTNQHYVPIDKSNVIKTIEQCLKEPDKYEHIRRTGMKFVRENHSVIHRINTFKEMFEEVVSI